MNHNHKWHYTNYQTVPLNDTAQTVLGFVCDCGAMKKVVGFDWHEPELQVKKMGRPQKVR